MIFSSVLFPTSVTNYFPYLQEYRSFESMELASKYFIWLLKLKIQDNTGKRKEHLSLFTNALSRTCICQQAS